MGLVNQTLVKSVSKEVGQGVIYVEIPANVYNINEAFEKAFNIPLTKFTIAKRIAQSFLGKSSINIFIFHYLIKCNFNPYFSFHRKI